MRGSNKPQRKLLPLTLTLSPAEEWGEGTRRPPPSAPPAPTAASAAACSPRPDGQGGAAIRGDPEHPANAGRLVLQGLGARRDAGARDAAAPPHRRRSPDELGPCAGSGRPAAASDQDGARPRGDRLLPLRPAADGGLLRRQQAGQGLHRHAARRHQLAAVHGLLGRRPSPRVRGRRGAAVLRRPGARRSRGAGGLQCRLVPPDPLPAHPDRARRARHARRQHRPAPHRDQRRRRPAAVDQARHRRRAVVGPAGVARRAPR